MSDLYFYTTPIGAALSLTLDHGGAVLPGVPGTANGRDDAQRVTLPAGTGQQGATLEVSAESTDPAFVYPAFNGRGILEPGAGGAAARFVFDDIRLEPLPAAPPVDPSEPDVPAPPNPNDPHDVVLWVYSTGAFDLTRESGCGAFVEACALTLYTYTSLMWGHVLKFPGQVQVNGHAIDAIHCLAGEFAGIWDIIVGNSAPGATPAFNYTGPADPPIWYPGNQAAPPALLAAATRRPRR